MTEQSHPDPRLLPTDVDALRSIRADALHRLGRTGAGIGIALIDTGVSEVPALAGRLRGGINLSGVGPLDAPPADWFGHGTFIAGLAAGSRDATPSDEFPGGVAPGAHVVPVKVAAPDGATDVSNVLAAIQWVVAHAEDLAIRVINLSFGTNSRLPFQNDPLNHAVERAWEAGIVVVVAAGNTHGENSVTTPGCDPLVLTVGSSRGSGTPTVADDRVEAESGEGVVANILRPDVVAPGERLVSLRVPGSFVDVHEPDARRSEHHLRATGTSFAAGLVSGAVALLLEAHPNWTPDQVKGALMATAHPIDGPASKQGAGIIDVAAADALVAPPSANRPARRGPLALHGALGLIEHARGTLAVERVGAETHLRLDATTPDTCCPDLTFEKKRLRSHGWTKQDWTEVWAGHSWEGSRWGGHSWEGHSWEGHSWEGHSWEGHSWEGHSWEGNHWWGNQWWGHSWE